MSAMQPTPSPPGLPKFLRRFGRLLVAEPLYWLLVFVPVAIVLEVMHAPGVWVFVASCVAIVPLAGLMGRATENLAETLGAGIGGLLNATFGNAAELIIALMALRAAALDPHGPGRMYALVKASLTGSIVGNILLVLGVAILAGGLRYRRQTFNRTAASMGTTLLALAVIGLLVPSIFYYILLGGRPTPAQQEGVDWLSEEIAAILAGVYLLSLVFALKTHRHLFAGPLEEAQVEEEEPQPEWSRKTSLLVLALATAGVALMSEFLVGSVEAAAAGLGFNSVFIGVIVVAIVGNAAEHSTAVLVALKDKMDLAVNIAIGSSLQIALFVAPVLVFASMALLPAQPLDLHFTPIELVMMIAAVAVLALISVDGETHWMEGVMLLAVYGILALAVYHLPDPYAPAG
ncbi:cation transporter [Planctomycetaceae bacterium SCGC AG-212-F19]|nr:cation transporter [Planctomycetaceae bacterium SCGC AG-212-F19]